MSRPLLPERWQTIAPLIDAALDCPPQQRGDFLDDACKGDADLRARVEALVDECERSAPLVDGTALERFAALLDDDPLLFGRVVADRYHIERKVGAGGMATVYLARDVPHDRNVALKVHNPRWALCSASSGSWPRSRSPPDFSIRTFSPYSTAGACTTPTARETFSTT